MVFHHQGRFPGGGIFQMRVKGGKCRLWQVEEMKTCISIKIQQCVQIIRDKVEISAWDFNHLSIIAAGCGWGERRQGM